MAQLVASFMKMTAYLGKSIMKKLPYHYRPLIFAILMSFSTALIVSGVMTWIRTASLIMFYQHWFNSFILAWPTVLVVILSLSKGINHLTGWLVETTE